MGRFLYGTGSPIPEYRTRASRSEIEPDNLLYQSEYARQRGFRAGLVPGSSIFAYISRSLTEFLGQDWLERGFVEIKILQPVCEGEEVRVTGVVASIDKDGTVVIDCQTSNPLGTVCAEGRVELPPRPLRQAPARRNYPAGKITAPRSIAIHAPKPGEPLMPIQSEFNRKTHWEYCQKGVRDHHPLYDRLLHPGWLVMQADRILTANFLLPSWIHVASATQNYSCQAEECQVETRGRVREVYECEGDHYMVLDLALFADKRCLQTIQHTVIFRIAPRAA